MMIPSKDPLGSRIPIPGVRMRLVFAMPPARLVLGVVWSLLVSSVGPARSDDGGAFDRSVATILVRRCLDCHSGADPKGKLDLSRRQAAMRGGEGGSSIVPGKLEESLLWERVESGEMPPKVPLPDDEKAALRDWIRAGAGWGTDPINPYQVTTTRRAGRDWWSLQPVRRPEPPETKRGDWARSPLDRFVLRKLEAEGLSPQGEADRRTLIRRLRFDLTGLPPTPEEVDAYLADESPDAYERLVDRLLASPDYGVRWARLWLDLARFGESNGFEYDEFRPGAYRYRDWVVDAFNRDLPYNEFVRLQLAGDVLRPDDPGAIEATGFLVAGSYDTVGQNQISQVMKAAVRSDELEDIVGTVGQTFLGLTVNCARCHDHKFDPIRQAEYFRFAAALDGVRHGERDLSSLDPGRNEAKQRIEQLADQIRAIEAPARDQILAGRRQASEPAPAPVDRDSISPRAIAEALPADRRAELARLRAEVDQATAALASRARKAYAVKPREPGVMRIQLRGNPAEPGDVVSPGGIASLASTVADFGIPPDAPDGERRRRLADWITAPQNPLFARVAVNRLWQAHFGSGLVETPSDLGFSGGVASNPELLDWLASELVARGWSLKTLHRLIVTSAAYRQTSKLDPAALAKDAAGRLLWRKAPTRLEAEMVRDAMLAVSGRLNRDLGGPSFLDQTLKRTSNANIVAYAEVDPSRPGLDRRTLYRAWGRGARSGLLDAFDCPDPSTTAPRRAVTTTPIQALALMNNSLVLYLADEFAARLAREAGADAGRQVDRAYRLALGRAPELEEREQAIKLVETFGAATLGRVLFNSNEFVYAD